MTLEKAIEILNRYLTHPYIKGENELQDAACLGIEALKRHKEQRHYPYCVIMEPLPGETKE